MPDRRLDLLLGDILESCKKIQSLTQPITLFEFIKHESIPDAVVRHFTIIGEAVSRLPEDFKAKYPEINLHLMKGMRNRIVHEYFGIDLQIVWETSNHFVPVLEQSIADLIDHLG